MKNADAVSALAALAQENRLDVFRLLVQAGPEGMPAGSVADASKIAPNTLTFHFDRLRDAGLVTVRREGRSMIYAARFEVMNELLGFLTENCCQGGDRERARRAVCKPVARNKREGSRVMKRMHVHVSRRQHRQRRRLLFGTVCGKACGRKGRLRQVDARRPARQFCDLDARRAARSRSSRHPGRERG